MSDPRIIPPPPDYPPTVGRTTWWSNTPPEPTVIVMAPEPAEEAPRQRLALGWRWRPIAAVAALTPGIWWAHTLTDPELTTGGAYVISGVAVLVTGGLDAARGWWTARVGLYAALIGPVLALPGRPALDLALYLITGVTS
ncbi:hypothetical protein ACH4TQ_46815 [Streptomyces sp. NPDC021218]|uniref:hypothetical protein n=1 Tax=Streptomyces sp. NPDC021218 TaxID=3365119 RepID=UPI00379DF01E